ncbi:MAG: DNA polymerase III subunit delta [Thermodesulfobacteriota bacterium]
MDRPGFTFLVCPDPELVRQRIRALLAGQGREFALRTYWGDDEPLPPAFWQDLAVASLFATPKAVVLRRADALPEAFWGQLAPHLAGFNAMVWPVFCLEGDWDKGKPRRPKAVTKQKFWAVADKRGWVADVPGLTPRTLPDHLRRELAERGLAAPAPVFKRLAELLPPDAAAAAAELDKLALAAGDRRQLAAADLAVVAAEPQLGIFDFLRASLEGTAPVKVWGRVLADHQAASNDKMLFAFLGLLAREARLLWELAHGDKPSVWLSDYARDQKLSLVKRLGPSRVAGLFDLALQAEMGVKSGTRDPEQAFEALAAGLHALCAGASRPGRPPHLQRP